jgi:cobalt-zinc-cadmium resistance protein CzcA
MSLGALDFGLIVDGAIVMVENAVRRRAEARPARSTEAPTATILDACVEVGRPVVFAVGIIMIVYVPILALIGIEGKMFRPMALTVMFALLGSLFLSPSPHIPAALTFVLPGHVAEHESGLIVLAKRWYRPALRYVMNHRVSALAIASMLVVMSALLFPLLGVEFIPRLDEGSVALESRLLPSVSISESVRLYSAAERTLLRFPEVTNAVSKIGSGEAAL